MIENKKSTPIVSVAVITYNQENFISQTIEGILMQKTTFPFEILISDDCSTDNTRNICLEYKQKYPDFIRLHLPEKNMGSMPNFMYTLGVCTGKYVALCEGDDYWIDENKLQKQVDFLEQNPEFSLSSHNSVILAHNGKMLYNPPLDASTYSTKDLIDSDWGIMTASIVFRREYLYFPDWFQHVKNGDYALQLLLSTKGKINYIPEYMSVYRRHAGGITSQFNPFFSTKALYILLSYFNKETNNKYKSNIRQKLHRMYKVYAKTAKESNLKRQYIGLQSSYFFSKFRVDIFSILSRFSIFQK